jgi:hypothetical protein
VGTLEKIETNVPCTLAIDRRIQMWSFEHFSNDKRPERQMLDFREVLSHCDAHDLGFIGVAWTFNNKQIGARNVRVQLDRAVASSSWTSWFIGARVRHLATSRSNHVPIFLEIDKEDNQRPANRISRYEIMWEREESLPEEICIAWQQGKPVQHLGDVAGNLQMVMRSLSNWSRKKFGAVTKELDMLRKNLEELST